MVDHKVSTIPTHRHISLVVPVKGWQMEQNPIRNAMAVDISYILELHKITIFAQSASLFFQTPFYDGEGILRYSHPQRSFLWVFEGPDDATASALRGDLAKVFAEHLVDGATFDGATLEAHTGDWSERLSLLNAARTRRGLAA